MFKGICVGVVVMLVGDMVIGNREGVDSLRYCNWHGCQKESMIGVITMGGR